MRRIRLFTVITAVGLAAALSPAAVGVAHAAAGHPARSAPQVSMWSRPWPYHIMSRATCPSAAVLRVAGELYQVKDTGIHIRVSPGGAASSAISDGTYFASDWVVHNVSGYQCIVASGGMNWVLGVSQSGASGWIGVGYLTPIRPDYTY